jgi:mannose-1-phosphate guanylyltransferase
MPAQASVHAVVLAGGIGSRFWPASRPERPKQLLPLGAGGAPLVSDAVRRAARLAGPGRVRVVAGRHLLPRLREAVPELEADAWMAEPEPRGTGPALCWAAHAIARLDPEAVMVSLHADHRIAPEDAFDDTLGRAVAAARTGGRLYCVGVPPDRPETGYGYIRVGAPLGPGTFEARAFVEKPDAPRAARYVASSDYLWNTGLFVWRVADFLEVVRERTTEIAPHLDRLDAGDVEGYFADVRPVSVDVGVMERAPAVGVVRATFGWDDLGVWSALLRALAADPRGNVVVGDARLVESGGNVVWAEDGRITTFGVDGLVVVRSGGETLVTSVDRAPELKRLLDEIGEPT